MKKILKYISIIIFLLPVLMIFFHIFLILNSLINGKVSGFFGEGPIIYGIEAMKETWHLSSLIGILYLPFIIYQIIYICIIKNKKFKNFFIFELLLILLLEMPLLKDLIFVYL